jgi:hypothetical protein
MIKIALCSETKGGQSEFHGNIVEETCDIHETVKAKTVNDNTQSVYFDGYSQAGNQLENVAKDELDSNEHSVDGIIDLVDDLFHEVAPDDIAGNGVNRDDDIL